MWICPFQCIETDETAKKPDQIKMPLSSEEEREAITQLEEAIATDSVTTGSQQILNSHVSKWTLKNLNLKKSFILNLCFYIQYNSVKS